MKPETQEYSGSFLWLALTAALMPVVVAVGAFVNVPRPFTYPEITPDASGVDQGLWNHLMQTYVADGLVDYDGLKRSHLFKTYLGQLATADPTKLPSDDHRLAMLCNAYNAFVINGVIIHKIDTGVLDYKSKSGEGFFGLREHLFAGRTVSADHIEHEIIRKNYAEPRIHVALVCAARSCPTIRPGAYDGEHLQQQLEDQALLFANNTEYVRYDQAEKKVYLSPILDWYGGDFGDLPGVIEFLLGRVEDAGIKAGLESVAAGEAEVAFNEYDWSLNTQGKTSGKSKSTGFGSGSIPNE